MYSIATYLKLEMQVDYTLDTVECHTSQLASILQVPPMSGYMVNLLCNKNTQ